MRCLWRTLQENKEQCFDSYLPSIQSSGAVWKSRWPSWAPVPNKLTVSVDVKQHFNQQVTRCLWCTLQENKEQYFDSHLPGMQACIYNCRNTPTPSISLYSCLLQTDWELISLPVRFPFRRTSLAPRRVRVRRRRECGRKHSRVGALHQQAPSPRRPPWQLSPWRLPTSWCCCSPALRDGRGEHERQCLWQHLRADSLRFQGLWEPQGPSRESGWDRRHLHRLGDTLMKWSGCPWGGVCVRCSLQHLAGVRACVECVYVCVCVCVCVVCVCVCVVRVLIRCGLICEG